MVVFSLMILAEGDSMGGSFQMCNLQCASHYPEKEAKRSKHGETGSSGLPGPPGQRGEKGSIGDKGDRGDMGYTGIKGVAGYNGVIGDKGAKGSMGIMGTKGIQGEKGSMGNIGMKGVPGAKGSFGDKGNRGDIGNVGIKGSAGSNGAVGDKGAKGSAGDKGGFGAVGDKGSVGNIGMKGEPGSIDVNVLASLLHRIAELEAQITKKISTDAIIPSNKLKFCVAGLQIDPQTNMSHIEDGQFAASSFMGIDYAPYHGRLFASTGNGGWTPSFQNGYQWIHVDLREDKTIYGVVTQGRHEGSEFVTSYAMQYRTDDTGSSYEFMRDEDSEILIFQGNMDNETPVINRFLEPITARYFQINPRTHHMAISLRFELLTC